MTTSDKFFALPRCKPITDWDAKTIAAVREWYRINAPFTISFEEFLEAITEIDQVMSCVITDWDSVLYIFPKGTLKSIYKKPGIWTRMKNWVTGGMK